MNDEAALGPKRCGHRQPLAIPLRRPGNDLRGFATLERTARTGKILEHLWRDAVGLNFNHIQAHEGCPLPGMLWRVGILHCLNPT